MSRIDTNFVKQLYSQAGVELTPEKLDHISNNYSSNEELQSAFELKYGSMNASTPEKKNSDVTSTSTSEAPQSESQQPQKKASSLSVGGKPKKTGASESSTGGGKKVGGKEVKKESKSEDLISKFGFKNKEEQKKVGVEASKIKVDTKTPSAVKSVSVKEEQFVKPELQKIQKEVSSPEFKKELEENKESILSKEQRGLVSSGIDSSIEMKQAEGLLPPTSELIKSGDIKLNIFSGGNIDELLNPKSFTEMLDQQSKPFVDQVKESNKPVKVNYDNLILANDYNLPNPYLYYSNSKNGGDNQVSELYTDNLSNLPINKDDFDGFLRKRGLLDDFNKDLSSGLYNEDRGTFSENYNAKLIKEKRLVDFLSMYISDRNQRDYDKRVIEYKKENPKATAEDINRNVSKFTFVSDQQFDDYIKNTFPTYTKSIEERKIKEKEQWEETKKNKGDFFSWQTLKKIGSGLSETISSRVSNLSSTVYDLIGMEDTAKQIRFSAEEDAFNRPENRDISYVSGKKVVYNDNEYLVDSNGQIYDYNLKKRVTDLFTNTDYKLITKAAEKGEDDNLFSWTGATVQTTNVLADLALQIALTRGAGAGGNIVKSGLSKEGLSILSKVPVSQGMASSATAQTFLGYSEGLENTLVAAKEAGISDSEAKALANDAAMKTAGLYLVTSGISPQTKASFVKKKNELIKEAIDVYAKKGKPAYIKFLNKGINGLKESFEEGTKETFQEGIQQAGTVYGVNQSINEQAGKEILQSEMTADEIISMLPSTFIAGGIPIMLRNVGGTFSKKDYLSNLDVASNNVDLSNKRLDELLSNNVITSEEHSKSKEDLRVYSQNKNKIPKDTSAEIVLDVAKGLDEISKLESQKQNLDKAFHSDIDEKIEKKREQIKDLYKKDKENESNKQTTGQVSEQEKPTTATEAETTDATQQKTELQSQEEVSEKEIESINKERKAYGLEPLKPTYRGTSVSEWESVKNGGNFKSEDGFGENEQNVTWVSDKKEYSEEYVKGSDNAVLIEFKPEAIDKSSRESGQENDNTGVRLGRGLNINDVQKVTDSKGNIIYESPKTEKDAVQKQITNEGVLQPKQSEMGLQEMEQGDQVNQEPTEQGKEKVEDINEISKTKLNKKEINTLRASLRASSPDSFVLEVIDAVAKGEVLGYDSELDSIIEDMIENGISINNVANLVLQDDVLTEKKNIYSKRKALNYVLNIGEKGTMFKLGQRAIREYEVKKASKQGKEIFSEIEGKDLSDKTTYDKVYDFLTKIENDLTDIQDNTLTAQGLPISVVKTAIKAMKAAMVAGKVASEVISAGIDALKNTDWYNKKTDVEKANLEPSLVNLVIESSVRDEGKSMAKAEDKKQMALTEKIAERAKTNVVKARLGKLSKSGIFRGRVSKVLSLSTIRPKDAKKILPKDLYDKYVGAIIKLAERGLTIKDTNIPSYEDVYDEIIPYFEEFEDKKAAIQEKIYNGEDLTVEEQAFFDKNKKEFFESESKRDESKNEEKEKEIAKNKQELKDLRSKLRDAFKKSNLEKGSKTFEYIDAASMLTDEQIDSMSNAMLKNAIKAFNSFINDGVAPGHFSQIYANSRTSKVESGISDIDKTAEKTGIYKYKIPKFIADVAQSIESFILNLRKLDAKEKMVARIEKYRGTQIDAALKIYRGTPIYDNVIAPIAEKLSLFSSDVEKSLEEMNLVYKSFLKSLKMSDDIFTSMLRIRYAQIYNMQKKNKGTKSGKVLAIDYFKETLKANIYSESENKKISDFIDYLESKGEDYDISNELTKAEQNAINGIRVPLDSNTESAYEERVFGNSNASPMIVDYVPVSGKDQMSDADINDLVKRFEKGSFVSGNLKEKTGKAHPIDLNPFSSAMSSIMSSKLQYHLRTEVLAIKRGINNALNEAKESGNKQKVKLLSAVSEAIDSYVDAVVVGNKIKATAMDKTIDNIATVVSTALLASETRAAAEFITNTPVLLADGLPMLLEGRKIVSDINELSNGNPDALREFLKTIGASQITSLMDKMKSASEKAGYTKKGVFANVMSSEIPTSAVKEKAKRFATDNKISNALGIYRNFLISGSDNMSRFTYFFGKFADEFKKEYGSPIEVDKVLDKNSDYLKDEKVLAAIKKASLTTNKETTELFGSNNPMERALVSLQASKGMKGKNPITKMLDYVGNYMNQFNRGVVSAMRKNINVAIEEKNGRELRKFLLQALRTIGYAPATVAISNLIGYAFYSDDDDEEQLKESLGKLREDEDLIKEVNGYFDFVKNKQEGDEYTKEEEKYRKDLMEKLMKNPEFKKAYDANYSFFNNKLLTQRISALTEKMNEGKSNFGLDSFERMIKIIDGDKETYGGSVEDFVKSMAYLNSERGMSYYSKEKRLELMEKIEDYFAENNFFDKRSVREREGVLDIQAGYDLLEKLYNYREKGLDDRLLEEGVKMGLNYTIGAKGNLVRSSYETGAEYINRKMIEKKFDHYDYKKDKTFDRPITKFGLDDKAGLSDIPKDLGRAITPAYIQYPTSMKESDIAIAKTLGLPFASSLNRAYNQKQKDEIYKETRGKFQENMLENINETALSAEAIRYILDKLEISMTEEEKEEVINIALTPGKGGDKGKTENKGRSSNRLKVGNKKLRGE